MLGFALSLPWQCAQWGRTGKLREETLLQERRLSELRAQHRDIDSAAAGLQQAPQSIDALLTFASSSAERNDQAGAVRALERVASLSEKETKADDPAVEIAQARIYQRLAWIDRAYSHAREAVRRRPDSVEALVSLAFIESHLGWMEKAWPNLRRAHQLDPKNSGVLVAFGLVHDQMGAHSEVAKSLREALTLRPDDWQTLILLAHNDLAQKKYDAALRTVTQAERLAPTQPAVLSARVEAEVGKAAENGGDPALFRIALANAQKFQQLSPESADACFWVGKALLLSGDEKGALQEWEKSARLEAPNATRQTALGQLLVRQGQRERGARLLRQSREERQKAEEYNRFIERTRQDFQNPESHRKLAQWSQAHQRLPRAILEWEQVLERLPADSEALHARDVCIKERLSLLSTKVNRRAQTP